MYSNIPLAETRHILNNSLEKNMVEPNIKHELLAWYDTITKQIFFSFKQHIHIPTDELAMGAPSSSILSEVFLQHVEHTLIPHLSMKHKLVNYFQFVDGILLIFDSNETDIESILTDFNTLHPNLKFTAEIEHNQSPGHHHTHGTRQYKDINLQETHIHGHHHPLHIKPPPTIQVCCSQVSIHRLNTYNYT
jgi:hypothetical protein